ncbi:hypothetical protein WA026_006002 [Henosepilachna vigintioctopunctata]|uniref:SH3 domain-containing protein n=1 Tax=Henosepilachna vigintioctopunctata TaxID=420089 RepID=A0AAW1U3W4_9CUCU
MEKETGVILRNKKDSKRIRQCRVVFSYKQDHEDELNLNVGDVIDVLGEEEEGWWKGVLKGKIGVFPSNFVEEMNIDKIKDSREDLNSSTDGDTNIQLPPKPAKILCEVKYNYKAQNEDELTLKEGDVVTLISKDGQDPGWWKGELNGSVGVFPDNFVVILPNCSDRTSLEKSPTVSKGPTPLKPTSIASQRKSLEVRNQNHVEKVENSIGADKKTSESSTPPLPGKKPTVAVKKSPSGSGSSSGSLFSVLKKKVADAVDGATSSKSSPLQAKSENTENHSGLEGNSVENIFDQVERMSMLTDVRATRVKAPAGRRPPSVVFKEDESGIPNGNVEPLNLEIVSENSGSSDTDAAEVKPKLREWEKHKAPWLAEMKLSQAKRTSPASAEVKPKLTPTERSEEDKSESKPSRMESEMSKSMSALSSTPSRTKTTDVEKLPLRPKPNLTNIPTPRPSSMQSTPATSSDIAQKPPTPTHVKLSPLSKTTSPPMHKIDKHVTNEVKSIDNDVTISFKQYTDLVERIHKLELLVEKQNVIHMAAIDELKGKLQLETELRQMLQVQLDKVTSQNFTHV